MHRLIRAKNLTIMAYLPRSPWGKRDTSRIASSGNRAWRARDSINTWIKNVRFLYKHVSVNLHKLYRHLKIWLINFLVNCILHPNFNEQSYRLYTLKHKFLILFSTLTPITIKLLICKKPCIFTFKTNRPEFI